MTEPAWMAPIARPTLVIDRRRVVRNLVRMADKATASHVVLRPHMKTHQSPAIGAWLREAGVDRITVSSVEMATCFAAAGWRDITIAFPFNVREAAALGALASRVRLGLLVDSADAVAQLRQTGIAADVWIDVDVGYGRTGVACDDIGSLVALARAVEAPGGCLRFAGLLTHAGHTYAARSPGDVLRLHVDAVEKIRFARAMLAEAGIDARVSIGDTPGCSMAGRFDGIDEIRPGNFLLYDLQQLYLGSCRPDDLALAVACPVVGTYPTRGTIVVHGGAVHLSKDVAVGPDGVAVHGRVAALGRASWSLEAPDVYVRSVSQEHGIISAPPAFLATVRPGSLLFVVPAHACLAVAGTRRAVALGGETLAMC